MHDLTCSGVVTALPVSRGYLPTTPLTWWQGRPVSYQVFSAHAADLANRLPARGAVLNLCEDRAAFILGWVAALSRGLATVLPADRTARAISQATADSGAVCALIDGEAQEYRCAAVPCLRIGYDRPVVGTNAGLPIIAADQIAAILYTSGSTGRPEPLVKHWGGLVSAAHTLGTMLGWQLPQGGSVIGAVAPQHMYGLETTVMLPLQWGGVIRPERPLLPADMIAALDSAESPAWLMVTPLHATSYVEAGVNCNVHSPAGIISSTMPLAATTAATLEQLWDTPVWEIYGSTETGMIGLRRTAQTATWQLVDDLSLTFIDAEAVVSGRAGMPAQKLHDQLQSDDMNHFVLLGRNSDMVKIGGKRAMLPELNAILCALPGVFEAALVQPEDGDRLVALVVADAGLDAHQIRDALVQRFDPAFLPRPVWLVDRLPRNDNGKLPRQALLDLITRLRTT
ncbi:MAG: AMP-binding protein [Betaproteobacteria bacterium]